MSRQRKSSNAKGFTLMEIIIVFILLGILAVAVIPTFTEMDDVGYKANQEGTLAALKTAWTVAYAEDGGNPTLAEVAALVTGVDGSTACACDGTTFMIECQGIFQVDGATEAEFGLASPTACTNELTSPAAITLVDGG